MLILAAIGLGALYMMHILAQDYQKIRKPVMKLARALLTKRDLDAVMATTSNPEVNSKYFGSSSVLKQFSQTRMDSRDQRRR